MMMVVFICARLLLFLVLHAQLSRMLVYAKCIYKIIVNDGLSTFLAYKKNLRNCCK